MFKGWRVVQKKNEFDYIGMMKREMKQEDKVEVIENVEF